MLNWVKVLSIPVKNIDEYEVSRNIHRLANVSQLK